MQLPSNILHPGFSEIDVNPAGNEIEIFYSTMVGLSGKMSEGWETGIAVDASVSMMDAFGKGLTGQVPDHVIKEYKKKGWIESRNHDGKLVHYWDRLAYEDAIKKGFLAPTHNDVEDEARKFSHYLAENLDEDGKTDIIYWACGESGKEIEEFGEVDSNRCKTMVFSGPAKFSFGLKTHLLPAVRYFEKKYRTAKRGLFVFITDGEIDDLNEIKDFTISLAKNISSGSRNLFKAILIGIGDQVVEDQMIDLDDLDTGTEVDIWDHKIAKQMKDLLEIFAELVDENTIIAPQGVIKDPNGNIVKRFNDGVPARGTFVLPGNSDYFIFEIGSQSIKQIIK